jgi:hypothetical protein
MKTHRIIHTAMLVGALLAAAAVTNAQEDSVATIKFSDPSKPGTLKIDLMFADIRVTGADSSEVTIRADIPLDDGKKRKDGLRSIGGGSAYRVIERDNVVTIDAGEMFGGHGRGSASFEITVPRSTSVVLRTMHGGETVVRDVTGDVEISSQNGDMRLEGLSGGVAADTMNGEIKAVFTKLADGKTYSFASMNGEIDLRVPASTKATVRFRAQVGEILTDFEENELVTRTGGSLVVGELSVPQPAPAPEPAIAGTRTPKAPKVPKPPFPAFGGQVVTGELNGGGPEIVATTMRGTITFRKAN